jgi:antitoxin HicB
MLARKPIFGFGHFCPTTLDQEGPRACLNEALPGWQRQRAQGLRLEVKMQPFVYRARFEPGDRRGWFVVTFPDVPEAITDGKGVAEALRNAEEALGLALLSYVDRDLPLPKPKARGHDLVSVTVEPDVGAKLALLDAVRERGMSKVAFARLIKRDEKEARRILDPKHPTKLSTLAHALRALGKRLVVGVQEEHAFA